MSAARPRIAVVGDDRFRVEGRAKILGDRFDVLAWWNPDHAMRVLTRERFDLVVVELAQALDLRSFLGRLPNVQPGVEALVVSAALPEAALVARVDETLARRVAAVAPSSSLLHGDSPAMHHARKLIERFAGSNLPVLILGESGTGKELAARALHQSSSRADRPFMAVNCAGLSESLIDSELFGHERGAFTGAHTSHKGLFDAADGGTLFLDEIGDVPPPTQVRLLRALQEGEVRPVGASRCHQVDVRVISATNIEMKKAVAEGQFRHDLYYRLSPIKIELPPLRERGRDILLLAHEILTATAGRARRRPPLLSPSVQQALLAYEWPGNVRELRSAIEYALSLARGEVIEIEDLPPSVAADRGEPPALEPIQAPDAPPPNYMSKRRQVLADFDRLYFEKLLRFTRGNLSEASRHSGVDRSNLRRILKDIGLNAVDFRPPSTR